MFTNSEAIDKLSAIRKALAANPELTELEQGLLIARMLKFYQTPKDLDLVQIQKLEVSVNEFARKIAHELQVDHVPFRIFLDPTTDAHFRIVGGSQVQIHTSYLPDHPDFELQLRRVLWQLPKVYHTTALIRRDALIELRREMARLIRKKEDVELSDFIPMLPAHRMRYKVEVRLIATDVKTGNTVEVVKDRHTIFLDDLIKEASYILARKAIIMNKEDWLAPAGSNEDHING